jgi:hypothetical protein
MTTTEPAKTTRPGNPPKPPGASDTVDAPRLAKTLDWALEQHWRAEAGLFSEWNQAAWMRHSDDLARERGMYEEYLVAQRAGATCGTACCIAGKVALDNGYHSVHGNGGDAVIHRRTRARVGAAKVAAELLGLTTWQADLLFSGGNRITDLYAIAEVLTGGEITAPPELEVNRDLVETARKRLVSHGAYEAERQRRIAEQSADFLLIDAVELPYWE